MLRAVAAFAIFSVCVDTSLAFSSNSFQLKLGHSYQAQKCNIGSFGRVVRRGVFPRMQQAAPAPAPQTKTQAEILSEIRSTLTPVLESANAEACVKALDG